MKTISEMSIECGCTYRNVYDVILKNNIMPIDYRNGRRKRLYHQLQVDLIYKTLYFERKCDMIVLESKMNKKETFEEFKNRTYNKKQKL